MCITIETLPGRFESEPCFTKLAYHWAGNNAGDTIESDGDGHSEILFVGPFTIRDFDDYYTSGAYLVAPMCGKCVNDVLNASNSLLVENSQGFVHAELNIDVDTWQRSWEEYNNDFDAPDTNEDAGEEEVEEEND